MKKILVAACFLFLLSACFESEKNPQRELSSLTFGSGPQQIDFKVETSKTPQELALGLMYRKSMPENQGMIFLFPSPRQTAFWMKNTYLPLDMIFVNDKHQISGIVENAKPLSEKLIYSPAHTIAVIELNAGVAKAKNLRRGMIVTHSGLVLPQK